EPSGDRADELTIGGVAGELPEERPAQPLGLGVGHLAADGGWGVVAPPLAAAERIRRPSHGPSGRAARLEHLVVLDALLVGAGRGTGRGPAGGRLGPPGPTPAVEADADQQLRRRHALALQLLDRRVG